MMLLPNSINFKKQQFITAPSYLNRTLTMILRI